MTFKRVGIVAVATGSIGLGGCCGMFGGDDKHCEATIEYTGGNYSKQKPFIGKGGGNNETQARTNACWDYCLEADPLFEGQYRIWLDSKDGRAYQQQAKKYNKPLTKKRIIIDDQTTLEKPFKECVARCKSDAAAKRKDLRFGKVTCTGG